MKNGWLILIGALVLSGVGYLASHKLGLGQSAVECAACSMATSKTSDALSWMKRDFALSDDEFAKVCALHEAYRPRCDAMCLRIANAADHVSSVLKDNPKMTAEVEAALHEYEAAHAECQHHTLQHVLDTAAAMKPEAGRAFVQQVLPHLLKPNQHDGTLHH